MTQNRCRDLDIKLTVDGKSWYWTSWWTYLYNLFPLLVTKSIIDSYASPTCTNHHAAGFGYFSPVTLSVAKFSSNKFSNFTDFSNSDYLESFIMILFIFLFSGFSLTEVQKKQAMLNACKSHPAGKPKGMRQGFRQIIGLNGLK